MGDQQSQAMEGRARAIYGQYAGASAFINPELIAIGHEKLLGWLKQEPRIAHLEHYLDDLFRLQAHVRSAEVEEVLGLAQEPLGAIETISGMLTDADMQFKDYTTADGEAVKLVQSNMEATKQFRDRTARATAWNNYADGYLEHKNALAANLAASVKSDVFLARVRRYGTALEASLYENNVPVLVYNNLLEAFRRNLPTWHKYWAVRKRALGVAELNPYDIWAPFSDTRPTVPYHDAIRMICEGMQPLGKDYVETMRRGLEVERWVDVYPNQGKRQGAFSYGVKGTYPFVFQSYTDDFESMSTLAHELGHSMHSYYTNKTQPMAYANYTMFAAETASNFNQAMVRAHLLATETDRDFQLGVLEEAFSNFHRYLFIMPTLARFELEFHTRVEKGITPSADDLIALMADLFEEGYGGQMHLDRERIGITWAQFPHLYARFYVFNYATGISAANALARHVRENGEAAAEKYLAFLKAGSSLYPVDALKLAGADMMTPEPVDRAFAILGEMVDRLDQLTR
jgi:oligoendopeptidase F